jgi:hypothetical protein
VKPTDPRRTIAFVLSAALASPVLILVGNWSVGQLWLPAFVGNALPTLGFFVGILLGPGLVAGACVQAFRKNWPAAGAAGCAAVGGFAGLLLLASAVRGGMRLRLAGYAKLGANMAPVIGAIPRFEAVHGRLPDSLGELSPIFVAELPRGAERVQYVREGVPAKRELYGNRWMLWSNAAWGMGFDSFVYFPNQQYPVYMFGGGPERVGEWVYVHE